LPRLRTFAEEASSLGDTLEPSCRGGQEPAQPSWKEIDCHGYTPQEFQSGASGQLLTFAPSKVRFFLLER
jgi:hypothetical protein